jgi:hypothetical protein
VLVFVANNDTFTLLQCNYDDASDTWSDNISLGEASKAAPALAVTAGTGLGDGLRVYWVANNASNDLLTTAIFNAS